MTFNDPYTYPGSPVLKNLLGLTEASALGRLERQLVANRMAEDVPSGSFDLAHLCAIHRHLFQDVYAWAGEIRTVEIAKRGQPFQFHRFIATGMADVHRRLKAADFLLGMDRGDFAKAAGRIIGDVNYVHPFREGNDRTQLIYLGQLATRAGYTCDLSNIDPEQWIAASRASHDGEYVAMAEAIAAAISPGP